MEDTFEATGSQQNSRSERVSADASLLLSLSSVARKKRLDGVTPQVLVSNWISLDTPSKDPTIKLVENSLVQLKSCLDTSVGIRANSASPYGYTMSISEGISERSIRRISDFRTHVRIETEKEALAYVTMFTGIDTHFMFSDSRGIRIFERDEDQTVFGSISKEWWSRLNLKQPMTKAVNSHFVVDGPLLVYPKHPGSKAKIVRIQERVSRDGRYEIVNTNTLIKFYQQLGPVTRLPYY